MADASGDAGKSAREMRRERHESSRPRFQMDYSIFKKFIVPVVVVLILAGIFWAMTTRDDRLGQCPGHWHATIDVVVDGQRAAFPKPPYSLASEGGNLPISMHMHRNDNGNVLHFEPTGTSECRGVQETLRLLDIKLDSNSIEFTEDSNHGPVAPGTHRENETHQLRMFLGRPVGDDYSPGGPGVEWTWEEKSIGSMADRQLKDRSKLLVLYGPYTDEQVETFQNSVPNPP